MPHVVLGLGTSLTDTTGKYLIGHEIPFALKRLETLQTHLIRQCDTDWLARSPYYLSQPWGARQSGAYLNACVLLYTRLAPLKLLRLLQGLEYRMGRRRHRHRWQKRCVDIDILLYGNNDISHPKLQIPHAWMWKRDFVLLPIQQLLRDTDITAPVQWLSRVNTHNNHIRYWPLTKPQNIHYNNNDRV